jgi:hypothetical protein
MWNLQHPRKNYITMSVITDEVTGRLRKLQNEEYHEERR